MRSTTGSFGERHLGRDRQIEGAHCGTDSSDTGSPVFHGFFCSQLRFPGRCEHRGPSTDGALAGADAVCEVRQLGNIGVVKQFRCSPEVCRPERPVSCNDAIAVRVTLACTHHSTGTENLAANVVTVGGLEVGLGRREGAVVEPQLNHRRIEVPLLLVLRMDESIGLREHLDDACPRVEP